jgi:hypothetical protein
MMKGVIYNQDCTEFFYINPPDTMSGELVDTFVDSLAEAGVGALFSNPNGMRVNVPSNVREVMWHGYDPNGPDDQPFFADYPKERLKNVRPMLNSMIRLSELGVDFHARALARCRERGMEGWISVRMNDVHDVDLPNSPLLSTFWKQNPDLRRVPYRFTIWQERQLDFAQAEVRQHYQSLIEEFLERYDLDGLELDFQRFSHYFRIGQELAGGEIMTAWLREIRALTKKTAQRLGHPVKLAVRCSADPESARLMGLDAVHWAHEGLVDLIVPCPFWETSDFNMPMLLWRRLLEGTNVRLAAGLEILARPYAKANMIFQTPQTAAGAAAAALYGGADVVYLFNFFYDMPGQRTKMWTQEEANRTLRAMASLETLKVLPRRHLLTYRDTRAPGEAHNETLPASGSLAIFRLQTGPRPTGRRVQVVLGFELPTDKPILLTPPRLRVNSILCEGTPEVQGSLATYAVPEAALADEIHTIEVEADEGKTFKIVWAEIAIDD